MNVIRNMKLFRYVFLVLIVSVLSYFFFLCDWGTSKKETKITSYWIWRNSDMHYPSHPSNLIFYQGNIDVHWQYQPLGVRPVQLLEKKITLLLRLYTLGPPEDIVKLYKELANSWRKFGVDVIGLQIDYDSPSARLDEYAFWLRQLIPLIQEPVSVTSLYTYINDNPEGIRHVAKEVDHIAMQLYHGFEPHIRYERGLKWLNQAHINYTLGITTSKSFTNIDEQCQENCQGINIFLNLVKGKKK